ncbi:hypothetical protein [Flammeovirga sp. EKP202]|uniref:hypothetical protein n=1 Tax=Flammeovirga sp. EKP202 TaxID=2770592 RepID=UPI00165FB341|nr:hypothetical protein [Flammeovirga sp. EKP202]MBD0400965.1 hypothetical protein [Flammeovirga sp. EKP202]
MKVLNLIRFIALNVLLISVFSCSNDDLDDIPSTLPVQVNTFATYSVDEFATSGAVSIELDENDKIVVRVELPQPVTEEQTVKIYNGLFDGVNHEVYLTLNPITSGETTSITEVVQSDNGDNIIFEQLVSEDRNLRVLKEGEDPLSIHVFTDLGENAFVQSGEKKYAVIDADSATVAEAVMLPRENEDTPMLVAVKMMDRDESKDYYPVIRTGTAATGTSTNDIIVSLPTILKFTNDNSAAVSFMNLTDYTTPLSIVDGFLSITEETSSGTEVGRGDVGGNELTGNYNDYVFDNEKNKTYDGTVRLQERYNGNVLVAYQMHSGDQNPGNTSSVGMYVSNHIQYNEGMVEMLTDYQAGSGSVFYSDVRAIKYDALLASDNHIRMFQGTDEKAGDYYVVSNLGTAAYTGTNTETSITYFDGVIAEPLKINLKQRVNDQTEGVIEFDTYIGSNETYEITIYKGTDFNAENPTVLVNFSTYDSTGGPVFYRDVHSDANSNAIDYVDMVGGQNHYRVKRRVEGGDYEYIGYGIIE